MKKICLLLVLCLFLSACSAFAEETAEATALIEQAQATLETGESEKEPFRYIHDPRQNPNAMQDIIENPAAVYGFSPDPNSTRLGNYADYDWTDPAFVAEAKKNREEYHASMESMMDIVYKMRDEGATLEAIARAVSAERNRVRLAASENDPEEQAKVRESNLKTYGNEEGPTPDQLYEKYGSWQTVLQKAFSPNLGMDAVCGLYDDYYDLYVELGLAEPQEEPARESSSFEKAEKPAAEMTAEEFYQAGKAAENAGDYAKALEYYQLAADLGYSEAIKEIGNLYTFGLGVEQDYDKAFEYYQRAADLGNFNAINNLGNCYMNDQGVEKNEEEALKYYRNGIKISMGDVENQSKEAW